MAAPSIFVIDDQEAVRCALGEMLRVFGHRVQTYDSAENFLRNFSSACRGCIVADVRMPGMDGIEFVRELARRGICLPVVLISGHADVPMAVAAIKAGAEDFIEKPINDTHLLTAINKSLAGYFDKVSRERNRRGVAGACGTPHAERGGGHGSCR